MVAWPEFAVAYLCVGIIAAGITFGLFPPYGGYRPSISLLGLAALTYTLLWPVVAMLAVGYQLRRVYDRQASANKILNFSGSNAGHENASFTYRPLYKESNN